MGLLNFKKKSRKQQSNKPFEFTHHPSSSSEDKYVPNSLPTTNIFKIESSVPKETETSLMDDIMNELDSAKSINNYANTSPITRQNKGKLINICKYTLLT